VACSLGALAVALAAPREARADSKAVAEALFRDGAQLLADDHIDEACGKLAESQKIDPALGTLLYLAACHEKQGRTASAWAEFTSARQWAERSNQTERLAFATQHVASLEPRLSAIVITTPPVRGLELRLDDGLLSAAVAGTPLPTDPGRHTVQATAPGFKPWTTVVDVPGNPGNITVDIPELTPVHVAESSESEAKETGAAAVHASAGTGPSNGSPAVKPLIWSAFGLAGAGIVGGTVFGALAMNARDGATAACPNNRCTQGGLDDVEHARTYATISTIAFAAGVVCAIGGGYLLWQGRGTDPHTGSTHTSPSATLLPSAGPGAAGVALVGRF
jgi:hypothetical protein